MGSYSPKTACVWLRSPITSELQLDCDEARSRTGGFLGPASGGIRACVDQHRWANRPQHRPESHLGHCLLFLGDRADALHPAGQRRPLVSGRQLIRDTLPLPEGRGRSIRDTLPCPSLKGGDDLSATPSPAPPSTEGRGRSIRDTLICPSLKGGDIYRPTWVAVRELG